jgi:hypothetical protein
MGLDASFLALRKWDFAKVASRWPNSVHYGCQISGFSRSIPHNLHPRHSPSSTTIYSWGISYMDSPDFVEGMTYDFNSPFKRIPARSQNASTTRE